MPSYRLYQLDGAGKIISADWLDAAADEDALKQARERPDCTRFELWDGRRIVSTVRDRTG